MSDILGFLHVNVAEAVGTTPDGRSLWDDDVVDGFVKGAFGLERAIGLANDD